MLVISEHTNVEGGVVASHLVTNGTIITSPVKVESRRFFGTSIKSTGHDIMLVIR